LRIRKITKGTFIGAKIINQKISAPKADIKTSAPKADIKTSAPKADIQNRTTTREPPNKQKRVDYLQNDTVTLTNRQYEEASPACLERVRAVRAVRHAKK
jgi:hypothetical protein